jgi:hypothetical protein
MNSELLVFVKNQVSRDLKAWSLTPDTLRASMDKMHTLMLTNPKFSRQMLCVTVLCNGTVSFCTVLGTDVSSEYLHANATRNGYLGNRVLRMIELIRTTATLYVLQPVRFYMYVSDSYCFEFRDLPLFVIAKPSNKEGILIPDDSFIDEETSWEQQVSLIQQNRCSLERKIPIVYFKGARTGEQQKAKIRNKETIIDQKWGTRTNFETYAATSNIMQIDLEGPRVPMYTWCKYKYLLNLPGCQPWSYRFKYLLNMQSVVIDIVVHQQYGHEPNTYNNRWDNFFDGFIRPHRDYVQVPFRWIEGDTEHNDREHVRVIQKVEKIFRYFENKPQAYRDMVASCNRRIHCIPQDAVYHGMSVVINAYAAAIKLARTDMEPVRFVSGGML